MDGGCRLERERVLVLMLMLMFLYLIYSTCVLMFDLQFVIFHVHIFGQFMAITIQRHVVLISNVIPCLGYVSIMVMVMDDIVHMPPGPV